MNVPLRRLRISAGAATMGICTGKPTYCQNQPQESRSQSSGKDREFHLHRGFCKHPLPSLGMLYGTAWKKERSTDLVKQALELGFRGVDTACQPKHYQEKLVGDALAIMFNSGALAREDVWIQTKFTSLDGQDPNRIPYDKHAQLEDQVRQSIEVSRSNLQVETIDSLVLHSPMRSGFKDTMRVWKTMEEAVDQGKVRHLGISNCYDSKFFQALWEQARHKPVVLQNRFYQDTGYDKGLRAFCLNTGIMYQSFWTLTANPHLLKHPTLKDLQQKYRFSSVTQVLYKYLIDLGHQPLCGNTTKAHVVEAVEVQAMQNRFSQEEMDGITALL